MYKPKLEKDIRCPLEYGLDLFGKKWKSRIICVLAEKGTMRYGTLRHEMANIHQDCTRALMNSQTVITAWDGDRLIGLVRALDDGEMTAYMHYVLVDPEYHGQGIESKMVEMIKEKYRDYLYVEIMPEESKNAPFYERLGFKRMTDGVAMQILNPGEKY